MAIYQRSVRVFVVFLVVVVSLVPTLPALGQSQEGKGKVTPKTKNEAKQKLEQSLEADSCAGSRPILWEDRGAVETLNLFYGSGGQAGTPNPTGKFTYIKDQTSGTQKKIIVKDEQGRLWTVKFGPEAKPETAASRIVWAVGYYAYQNYFVPEASIEGYSEPVVHNVRFQRRDVYKTIGNWEWDENPFLGQREFGGLKVLMALLNNWDLKELNNKITCPETGEDKGKLIYFVSDLGATFGRTKSGYGFIPFAGDAPADRGPGKEKAKGDPAAYAEEKFVTLKPDGRLKFYFGRTRGKRILKDVSIEDARWLASRLARLSEPQLADAFRASGFSQDEMQVLVQTLRQRIQMLVELQ